MTTSQKIELEQLAIRVRSHIVRMATNGGCFIGASLSCAEIMVFLYSSGHISVSPTSVNNPDRDYILLSKGHDVPALYGTLAELGYFPKERLLNHLKTNDSLYWHPNRLIPGVEFHSGSLGHLLAVGIGIAYDCKHSGGTNRIFVVMGDGEMNEGSVWEGLLVASALRLNNLTVIIDRNGFQANMRTEELVPLEPLETKLEAFGWKTQTVNGHSFDDLEEAFLSVCQSADRPSVIIAHTVRGKGIPSIESKADRWFMNVSQDEIEMLLDELRGNGLTVFHEEGMIVR